MGSTLAFDLPEPKRFLPPGACLRWCGRPMDLHRTHGWLRLNKVSRLVFTRKTWRRCAIEVLQGARFSRDPQSGHINACAGMVHLGETSHIRCLRSTSRPCETPLFESTRYPVWVDMKMIHSWERFPSGLAANSVLSSAQESLKSDARIIEWCPSWEHTRART
jgi:hypothetical protein